MVRMSSGCLLRLAFWAVEFLVFWAVCQHFGDLQVVLGSANDFGVCKQRGQPSNPPGATCPTVAVCVTSFALRNTSFLCWGCHMWPKPSTPNPSSKHPEPTLPVEVAVRVFLLPTAPLQGWNECRPLDLGVGCMRRGVGW